MTDHSLADTLDAYASTWGPLTHEVRMESFKTCIAEDFVYTDPNTRTTGYEELAGYMDGFQQQLPGGGFVNRDIAQHHDSLLVHWDMVDPVGVAISPRSELWNGRG